MPFYLCTVLGDGTNAEGDEFRPAISALTDTWHIVVDGRPDDTRAAGSMLCKAGAGLSGAGVLVMRRSMLADLGMSESGFQDDADDHDLCRQLARRLLLRRWLGGDDLPITLNTRLSTLPLTLIRNRIVALQPGRPISFAGLTGSSTVGQALAQILPQIDLPLEPQQIGQGGTFTDNFNNDTGSNVNLEDWTPSGGTAWTRVDGTAGMGLVSNASDNLASNTTDTNGALFQCDDQGSADQYTQYASSGVANISNFCCGRASTRADYIGIRSNAPTPKMQIYKRVAGTFTQLGSNGATTVVVGNTLRLESSGNNHTGYLNGVVQIGPIVDSHNNTITRQGFNTRLQVQNFADNFEAGLITAAGGGGPIVGVGALIAGPLYAGRLAA